MAKKPISFLQSAIPLQRGVAKHYERQDERAFTEFDNSGKVKSINTPQEIFRRVHEVMHARHTKPDAYPGIKHPEVLNIIEDCRLHTKHWPWPVYGSNKTPPEILQATKDVVSDEIRFSNKMVKDGKCKLTDFVRFATSLRNNAVLDGVGLPRRCKYPGVQGRFASELLGLITNGRHQLAAKLLEEAFFGHEDDDEEEPKTKRPESEEEIDGEDGDERSEEEIEGIATMQTIELPLTESTTAETTGYRLAKSGNRLYRPALRRPVLPERIFWRSSPVAPGGAVLFDASGSMGVDKEMLLDCCLRAPAASIAFYSGDDSNSGILYVFARDGQRADDVPDFDGGNSVDGSAMDWLMKQEGPRMFVTDRGFCGSADSTMQLVRLGVLEAANELAVYTSYAAFQEAFAKQASI